MLHEPPASDTAPAEPPALGIAIDVDAERPDLAAIAASLDPRADYPANAGEATAGQVDGCGTHLLILVCARF